MAMKPRACSPTAMNSIVESVLESTERPQSACPIAAKPAILPRHAAGRELGFDVSQVRGGRARVGHHARGVSPAARLREGPSSAAAARPGMGGGALRLHVQLV